MINASQIKEHMEVKGSDGKHVGTVLGVENGRLNLASGGMHHDIDIEMVEAIRDDTARLRSRPGCRSHLALRQLRNRPSVEPIRKSATPRDGRGAYALSRATSIGGIRPPPWALGIADVGIDLDA